MPGLHQRSLLLSMAKTPLKNLGADTRGLQKIPSNHPEVDRIRVI